MKILVTGCAGFIGWAISRHLLERGEEVAGVDNLNDYYSPELKQDRLAQLLDYENFNFKKIDIADIDQTLSVFEKAEPERVAHMAAQAGVRYSIKNPHAYVNANLVGFVNILEGARKHHVEHLVYASSSSVYGANTHTPFSESDCACHPVSLYGATKRSNELMGHSYSHLFAIPMTALRYFTVYGPWGRPDMSPMLFTGKIYSGETIQIFNHGDHERDFTFIDDVVEATVKIIYQAPAEDSGWDLHRDSAWNASQPDPASRSARHRIYNVGNQNAINLLDYIEILENETGKKAVIEYAGPQAGDVLKTLSDSSRLQRDFDFEARVPIKSGIRKFIQWYKNYYKVD